MWSLLSTYHDRPTSVMTVDDVNLYPYAHIGIYARSGFRIVFHHTYDDKVTLTVMHHDDGRGASFRYDPNTSSVSTGE
jgi:hypothetical protein